MLRSLSLALLGLGLLAAPAMAQTTPAKARTTTSASTKATVRRTNRLNDAVESEKGQSGYAAPGQPVQDPRYNGKNTPPYDGAAAPAKKGTTLATPK